MSTRKVATVLVCTALLGGAIAVWAVPAWRQNECNREGGLWMPAHSQCQTQACVDTGNCLPSYNNSAVCESLPLGLGERQLIVQLGTPVRREGSTLFFEPSATQTVGPKVLLDDQRKAKQFVCRGSA
jgi:hypothetical protein